MWCSFIIQLVIFDGNIPKLRGLPNALTTKLVLKGAGGQPKTLGTVTMLEMYQWIIRSQAPHGEMVQRLYRGGFSASSHCEDAMLEYKRKPELRLHALPILREPAA